MAESCVLPRRETLARPCWLVCFAGAAELRLLADVAQSVCRTAALQPHNQRAELKSSCYRLVWRDKCARPARSSPVVVKMLTAAACRSASPQLCSVVQDSIGLLTDAGCCCHSFQTRYAGQVECRGACASRKGLNMLHCLEAMDSSVIALRTGMRTTLPGPRIACKRHCGRRRLL